MSLSDTDVDLPLCNAWLLHFVSAVLCELFVCSHKKKRMNQIKKMMQRGLLDPEKDDPFALFMASTNIRYCYYADTHKILGNTFGMYVLQVCIHYTDLLLQSVHRPR